MTGDAPVTRVNWNDPTVQSRTFVGNFGSTWSMGGMGYIGRPTGIAIGVNGSLFVADDKTGNIIRIRPLKSGRHGPPMPPGPALAGPFFWGR
jgi:glucose/arabinose dehydrogenase